MTPFHRAAREAASQVREPWCLEWEGIHEAWRDRAVVAALEANPSGEPGGWFEMVNAAARALRAMAKEARND